MNRVLARSLALVTAVVSAVVSPALASAAGLSYRQGPIVRVSNCSGQNAEVEQATDPARGYVYEEWMAAGCQNIAFARSIDGGKTFSAPISVPGSTGSTTNSWDPAVTVGSDGTVYAAYMIAKNNNWFPVVAASHNRGLSFDQVAYLQPPGQKNWGDRVFLAVDPTHPNTVYVTYDYGPDRSSVTYLCASNGSCAFATGDLNVVVQKSVDGGKTWNSPVPINPGTFPASGGDSAPIFVEPNGRIDLAYQGYTITNTTTYAMDPAHMYYVTSTDGIHWSDPVRLGPQNITMSLDEWWIDGALAVDSAGNLFVSWDTQDSHAGTDTGWLSYSTDHGQTWSPVIRVTDSVNAPHIMEATAGAAGTVYVSWLSTASPFTSALTAGYAEYLRTYSIDKGWLTPPIQVSGSIYGDPNTWPGDTTGISTLASNQVVLSWGSGVVINNQPKSEIFSTVLTFGR